MPPYILRLRIETVQEKERYHEDIYMVAKDGIIRGFMECNSNGRLDELPSLDSWTWNYYDSKSGDVSFRTLNEKELEELSRREGSWKRLFD